ncbi:MAG: hypothetical protein DRJ43_00220 [Thermoprotei archaeon]|nr:MAG: hypothetical protein DRJ43_00220 [Thermoprotei archaeon]
MRFSIGREGRLRALAKLGDPLLNFVVSAALTLYVKSPRGVKVSNKLLRDAASSFIARHPGVALEDLYEALVGYAWLRGVSVDRMVDLAYRAMRGATSEEEALKRALVKLFVELYDEEAAEFLLSRASG